MGQVATLLRRAPAGRRGDLPAEAGAPRRIRDRATVARV